MLSLSELSEHARPARSPVIRSSAGRPGLFLSSAGIRLFTGPAAARPWPVRRSAPCQAMHSTPQHVTRHVTCTHLCGPVPASDFSSLAARLGAPEMVQNQGRQTLHPRPKGPGGVVILEPLWERPAGTQTHSRRTGRKLGHVSCARQGLVRVSESNTKYGGQRGITGGNAAPVMAPSISESSGIPKPKKSHLGCGLELRPAVHRRTIYRCLRIDF